MSGAPVYRVGISGSNAKRVLAAIGAGNGLTIHEIFHGLRGEIPQKTIIRLVSGLIDAGHVAREGGSHTLTTLGLQQLPRKFGDGLPGNWRPLQRPAAPPRRAGSEDHKAFPSVAAGHRLTWRQPL